MEPPAIEGGCYCGAVRYRATRRPHQSNICHCVDCRRICGAQSVAWVTFRVPDFAFVQGEPVRFASSPGVVRTFCGRCGTPMTYQHERRPKDIDVTTGSLDDPEAYPPKGQVYAEQKLSWV